MAVVVNATFDAATSGEATTATTGAASVSGPASSRQHSTVQKISGASLYLSGSSVAMLVYPFGVDTGKVFTRLYFRRETTSTDANPCSFLILEDTAIIQRARLAFASTTGSLIVRNGAAVVATYPVTTSQWYRVDWSAEVGIGQRAWLYTGATLHSASTADAVAGGTLLALSGSATFRKINLGEVFAVTPPVNFYVDEFKVDTGVMPPPFVPPAAGRRLERKVAGAWVPYVLEKKVSGAWVPQIVEQKNAGVWS